MEGTVELLRYFEEIDKFVYMSSSSVYGERKVENLPVKENQKLKPSNPYAISKAEAEKLVNYYSQVKGFKSTIIRPFSVYGSRQRPDEVFTSFISRVLDEESIQVYGDGSQTRDFTFIDDVVEGTYLAGEKGDGVYNIGAGRRKSVEDVIEVIRKVMEEELKINYIDEHEGDVSHTHANISKAKRELDYQPQDNIEIGVKDAVKWVRDMKNRNLL